MILYAVQCGLPQRNGGRNRANLVQPHSSSASSTDTHTLPTIRKVWGTCERIETMTETKGVPTPMIDAKTHIEEAYRILTGEVFNGPGPDVIRPVDGICTLVWDLERIDAAIGERGKSVFAAMAQTIQQAYIEICAARATLSHSEGHPTR